MLFFVVWNGFQFLIGSLVTFSSPAFQPRTSQFQFLIGSLVTLEMEDGTRLISSEFQFLIGSLVTETFR